MPIGALIIGDEIMRGKRQDKHLAQLIAILRKRGLVLAWCQYLGDAPALITATLKRLFAGADIVFSFGGIDATPRRPYARLRRGRGRRRSGAASGGGSGNPRPLRRRHHAQPPQDGRVSARREHHT